MTAKFVKIARPEKVFVGDRLRRLRAAKGMRQGALAAVLAVRPAISARSRPTSAPPAPRDRIAAFFAVDESYFADNADELLAVGFRETAGDPLFAGPPLSAAEARAVVRAPRPQWPSGC